MIGFIIVFHKRIRPIRPHAFSRSERVAVSDIWNKWRIEQFFQREKVMSKQEVVNKIKKVLERHRYVMRAELFGSRARGDDSPGSDVDLLVVYDDTRPKSFRAYTIYGDLEDSLGRSVDIVQEKLLHSFVKENIREDRELIYERH